jgi:glycerophosphoryl diester phosphodiesterase
MKPRALESASGRVRIDARSATCCVGHRGARAFAPENTLPAFRKAAAMGCAMVELDVHLSRDGELVVHHDDRLTRCTDLRARFGPGRGDFVSDFSLAELQALDAGSWYVRELALPAARRQPFLRSLSAAEIEAHLEPEDLRHYASGAVRIPTLRQVFELASSLDLLVNVEIKAIPRLYDGIAARVVAQVVESDLVRSVLISSFDHEQLLIVRRLHGALATGVLSSDRLARPADYLALLDADGHHPGCHGDFDSLGFGSVAGRLDARGIEAVQRAGGMVFVWTCNEAGQMAALRAAGVTGIVTDYPNRFAEAAAQRAG